jgi:hypothetical protein
LRLAAHLERRGLVGRWRGGTAGDAAGRLVQHALSDCFSDFGRLANTLQEEEEEEEEEEAECCADWSHEKGSSSGGGSRNGSSSSSSGPSAAFGLSSNTVTDAALHVVRQEALFAFRCHRLDCAIPLLLDEAKTTANATNATTTNAANATPKAPAPAAAVAAVLRYLRSGKTGLEPRRPLDGNTLPPHRCPPPPKLVAALAALAERAGVSDLVAWCQRVEQQQPVRNL